MPDIIKGIKGLSHVPSWLVAIDSDIQTIERYLRSRLTMGNINLVASAIHDVPGTFPVFTDYRAGYDAFLTLSHETVHFWHSISTPFMYYYSLDYVTICLDVVAFADRNRSDIFPDDIKKHYQRELSKLEAGLSGAVRLRSAYAQWARDDVLDHHPSPISTLQVIEGCAVLCAYRLCDAFPSHENFLRHLTVRYPNDTYAGAYHTATEMLGEAAFDLFAPACYLALHNPDNPGNGLYVILQRAKERIDSNADLIEDPLTFLLEAIETDEERCFPMAVRRTISLQQWLPVLKPYIERIAHAHDLRTADVFARPYVYFYQRFDTFFRDMLPPIHVYTKNAGRFSRTGLAVGLGEEYIAEAIRLSTLVGIVNSLIDTSYVMPTGPDGMCHHKTCPVYKDKAPPLCQCYVAFPPDDYKQCKFPDLLKWFALDRFLSPDAKHLFFGESSYKDQ